MPVVSKNYNVIVRDELAGLTAQYQSMLDGVTASQDAASAAALSAAEAAASAWRSAAVFGSRTELADAIQNGDVVDGSVVTMRGIPAVIDFEVATGTLSALHDLGVDGVKLLGNVVNVRWWTDDVAPTADASALFTAANDYALAVSTANNGTQLLFTGEAAISDPITLGGEANININFAGSQINVVVGGMLEASPNQSAITIMTAQSQVTLGTLDCNLICGGYRVSNAVNTKFVFNRILQFIWRGLTVDTTDGSCAGAIFYGVTGNERASTDHSTTRTATGIYNDANDVRFFGAHIGYCLYPIWNGVNGNGAEFINCHPFNSGPGTESGGAQHPFTFVNECTNRAFCYHCYFDNGYIDDRTATLWLNGGWELHQSSTVVDPIFRVKMPANPATIRGGANDTAISMGFYTGTWSGPSPTLTTLNYSVSSISDGNAQRVEYTGRLTKVMPNHGTTNPDFHEVKQGSVPIRHQFSSDSGRTRVNYHEGTMRVGSSSSSPGDIRLSDDGAGAGIRQAGASELVLRSGGTESIFVSSSGVLRPYTTDNTQNLGSGANRWQTVYAGTGTINTSDVTEKQDIRDVTAAEKATAKALKKLFRAFRFKDAVVAKGDAARIHFGVMAQEAAAAFTAQGLDPFRYGVICYDEWDEQPEVIDEDGVMVQPYRAAGARYGVRYDELFAFILTAL